MTRTAAAASARESGLPWRGVAVVLVALAPSALLAWLLAAPDANRIVNETVEHLVITTNVSVVALVAGLFGAATAIRARQYGTLLVALGFVAMAGFFTVHGLATPNVLMTSEAAIVLVGISAQLALLVPALLFALRYSGHADALASRVPPRALVAGTAALLCAYLAAGLAAPDAFVGVAGVLLAGGSASYDPTGYGTGAAGAGAVPLAVAAVTTALYAWTAWAALAEFRRTRLPLHGALALSFVLLAQAELSQLLAPIWSLAWWEYHALMLAAVALALGALFVELDRRRGLERFLPAPVVERVIGGDAALAGERRLVTILFTDLRGSTALADRLEPERVVAIVNEYLRAFAGAVLENGGIVDKFTGDGVMATFGALGDPAAGARAAAAAARDVRARVGALNAERARRGEVALAYGVGIHTGEAVVGAVGLPERSEYTALGDAVNLASRMESLTKELGVDVVVSDDTARRLEPGTTRPLGSATVKGKAAPLEVHTLA